MKLINKYANSRYSKMNEYYCGITTELDKLAGLDPNGHWKHYVLCDYEDGCFLSEFQVEHLEVLNMTRIVLLLKFMFVLIML